GGARFVPHHVRPGHQFEHYVTRRHRHCHWRHGGRGHYHDRECAQASRTSSGQKAALGNHPRRGGGRRPCVVLFVARHYRFIPAGVHTSGRGRPVVQTTGFHQDIFHGRSRAALHHTRPGAHGLVYSRENSGRRQESRQSPAHLDLSSSFVLRRP